MVESIKAESTKGQSLKRALEASGEATTSKRRKITFLVKYRDDHKRVLEGSKSTTRADIVGFVKEKYPHLPKINLVYEDNREIFVLDDDDFNIIMEESKDDAVIISVERYGVYCVGLGIEVAAISPIAERIDYHRLLMGITVGAFLVNLTDYHRGILGLKWVCEKAVNGARWIRSWIRSTFTRDGQGLPITNEA
ncbi:hypothetical protein Tco_1131301 [Tanacetum coccineum]